MIRYHPTWMIVVIVMKKGELLKTLIMTTPKKWTSLWRKVYNSGRYRLFWPRAFNMRTNVWCKTFLKACKFSRRDCVIIVSCRYCNHGRKTTTIRVKLEEDRNSEHGAKEWEQLLENEIPKILFSLKEGTTQFDPKAGEDNPIARIAEEWEQLIVDEILRRHSPDRIAKLMFDHAVFSLPERQKSGWKNFKNTRKTGGTKRNYEKIMRHG